ncbi:MAG: sporulation protein YqfD [Firmicutes bacterium]|nr:sporulation protein YqfD [Bacillota bacterium]
MTVKIEGFRIDKLLDKGMKEGICFRDVQYLTPISLTCSLTPYDLDRLKKIAKSLYRITEVNHRGAAYRAGRFLTDPLKVVGVIITCILVISQSFFVKTIEVDGYRAVPEQQLRKTLAEAGIKEGSYRPSIDWQKAEALLYDSFPQIVWVQLVYDGRKVFLNVAETGDSMEEIESGEYYCNIVAAKSGYIENIEAYRGLALAEAGDYVNAGDVLISGYVPTQPTVYDEEYPNYYYVKSKGVITAKIPYRLIFNQERYTKKTDFDGKTVVNKREKTEAEIKEKAEQQLRIWVKENLPEKAEILSKNLNFSYKESIIEVGVTLEVREEIGKEQEIVIGQKSTDQSGH